MDNYFQELPLDITFIICSYSKSEQILIILDLIPDLLDRAELPKSGVFTRLVRSYQPIINYNLIKNPRVVYDILFNNPRGLNHQKLITIAGVTEYNFYSEVYKYKECQYIFMRGQKFGKFCGKKVIFYKYCFACLAKKQTRQDLEELGVIDYNALMLFLSGKYDK